MYKINGILQDMKSIFWVILYKTLFVFMHVVSIYDHKYKILNLVNNTS